MLFQAVLIGQILAKNVNTPLLLRILLLEDDVNELICCESLHQGIIVQRHLQLFHTFGTIKCRKSRVE